MRVFIDFDGTVATCDVTDHVLKSFADPEWLDVEAEWLLGHLSAADCMKDQIAMIRTDMTALDALLDTVEIDPGFGSFVDWCKSNHLAITIVSDGVDYFIRRVLAHHGFGDLPVVSNHLVQSGRSFLLETPWKDADCNASNGVCKCNQVWSPGQQSIYVGDGRSDECVAPLAEILFAKDRLADFCSARSIPFRHFKTFHDVTQQLKLERLPFSPKSPAPMFSPRF
tara:strand:+ start:16311 stop:16985 length:675 start_codon:yes stop_codon:yes gene_type:complete